MKTYLLSSVGLMALAVASTAHAADAYLKAPPPAAWSWSGFYVGAHGGYGWSRDPQSDVFFGDKFPIGDVNSKGGVWGFQAGANWQSGSWVGGLEIDLSGTGIRGSTSAATLTIPNSGVTGATLVANSAQTDRFDLLGSARARLGFLPLPNLLIYGTAGPAWTRLNQIQEGAFTDTEASGYVLVSAAIASANPTWRFGVAAGAGVEARLGDSNWLGRVEYLHYDFGDSGGSPNNTSGLFSLLSSGTLTADVVRAGLSYKFTQARPGSAYATAMPVKAAPAAPWTWSGFYIGAHGGYGWGRDPLNPNTDAGTVNSNGAVGGLQAGANWQSGAVVGGLEIDASASSIKGSVLDTSGNTDTDRFELLNSGRARLGYLVLPGTMLYGTGGAAWTRLVQTFSSGPNESPVWEFGWVAGVGVETRIGATSWLGRVEYLHYDFGDQGSQFSSSSGSNAAGDQTVDVVRAGVSYKLDSSAAGPARVAMPIKASAAAAWSWDGFYIGGHGGYGWARDPQNDAVFGNAFTLDVLRTDIKAQGFVAGFQAGANWQIGSVVAGLETDLSATGIKGSSTDPNSGGGTQINTDKFDTLGSARARLGYLVLPNVLFYGTGGAAWTRVNQTQTDVSAGGSSSGSSSPNWRFGWVAGAGSETRLWDSNWLLRLEYLHYDFGDSGSLNESGAVNFSKGSSGSESLTSGHLTADVVRGGLSYKFR